MAKKKTRLQELQDYAKSVGITVATWSPGDGVTRYRFFEKAGPGQTYFGPLSPMYTALGLKEAWNYLYGYGAGGTASSHATRKKLTPQEARRELEADGIDFHQDFHTLSSSEIGRIGDMAAHVGYRKRKDAPGSTVRMYFQYLSRLRDHAKAQKHTIYDLVEVNPRTKSERVLHEHFSTREHAKEAADEYKAMKKPGVSYRIRPRKIAAPAYRWNPED